MKGGKQELGPTPPAAAVAASSLYGDVLSRYLPSSKRPSQALYHQTIFGAPYTLGHTEDWYSIDDALAKRPRLETASSFPIYPQRPGAKDCAHYMLTRTCKFGDTCKFDHPLWVPEGGIPDWKEVPIVTTSEILPERPGQPDCPYFLKTQTCKYGLKCKFNHPKDKLEAPGIADSSALPERPSEPLCAFYMKTGKCKFGGACKFHHPKDIQIPSTGKGESIEEQSVVTTEGLGHTNMPKASYSSAPAVSHNSKGLPLRPGEVDCPFYMKTGSCKYSANCRYNHPDWNAINPPVAALDHMVLPPLVTNFSIGVMDPAVSYYQPFDPALTYPAVAMGYTSYPHKPGQPECDHYMKTGECRFGERCKFHHPADRIEQSAAVVVPGGLPRREDAVRCPYYMKTGTCKYAASCKFDHPPPEEVMVSEAAASQ